MQDDEVIEDDGPLLPEEKGVSTDDLIENGVMLIARHFGFSDALFGAPDSRVLIVELQFQLANKNLDLEHDPSHKKPEPVKPFWRFW